MKIEDVVYVRGRGYVFLGEPEKDICINDKVQIDGAEFEVRGIERIKYVKSVGLILSPNNIAYVTIQPGDEIKIISQ